LLITAGGTGGHIYPALAVAQSLRAQPDAPELAWVGGHRGLEAQLVRDAAPDVPLRRLLLRSLRSVDRSVHTIADPARLALSVPQAFAILARERPDAIFTTGGYVAIPVLLAAAPLRIPVVLWEGNVIPGRSVRAVARFAGRLAVSFEATCVDLGRSGSCYVTGTPIRDVSRIDRLAARGQLDLGPTDRMMLIFGGSQAVRRFNAAVSDALGRLVERVHVLHVAGDAGYPAALADRERLPEELRARYRPHPFLREDMLTALAAADLVVGRAGSSTLAEVTALGLPMVVVPYPHAAGHQRANARVLVEAGGARFVEDEDFDAAALLDAAGILEDPALHARMSAASRSLGRPGAADAVAELIIGAAMRRPLPDPAVIEHRSRTAA
ncbi:MAG: UDP-N-acetylglucosamine--N-acetylmuramyl-(pentapeptide) pyrophosphoryl-undecaprenol N-acetylglucosamine transferase, partial [Chloroflexi bacterium]|nr:UDP-N-acetylglucosamine--N-acetylmuramyl-(pentapeptide) pyrophosphoryl-undecaprenol N-acetylglucosamine transferase [Chloroflexota bacterium]